MKLFHNTNVFHAYRSKGSKGLCFDLANLYARDHEKRKVKQKVLNDGYGTGQLMERNGTFVEEDGRIKFRIDYTRDKQFIMMMTELHKIVSSRHREIHSRVAAGKQAKKLYCDIVLGILPKLIAEMADFNANANLLEDDPYRESALETVNGLKDKLRLSIQAMARRDWLCRCRKNNII